MTTRHAFSSSSPDVLEWLDNMRRLDIAFRGRLDQFIRERCVPEYVDLLDKPGARLPLMSNRGWGWGVVVQSVDRYALLPDIRQEFLSQDNTWPRKKASPELLAQWKALRCDPGACPGMPAAWSASTPGLKEIQPEVWVTWGINCPPPEHIGEQWQKRRLSEYHYALEEAGMEP